MGWLYLDECRTNTALVDEIKRDLAQNKDITVLDSALTSGGRHLWVAMEYRGVRFVMLYLMSTSRGAWGYKDMDESMGPCYYDCPKRLLAVTEHYPKEVEEPRSKYALEWREKVIAYHAEQKNKREVNAAHKRAQATTPETPKSNLVKNWNWKFERI